MRISYALDCVLQLQYINTILNSTLLYWFKLDFVELVYTEQEMSSPLSALKYNKCTVAYNFI